MMEFVPVERGRVGALVGVALVAAAGGKLGEAVPWLLGSAAWMMLPALLLPAPALLADAPLAEEEAPELDSGAPGEDFGLRPYEHKVGGHSSEDGLDVCVFNENSDEVLKRLQPQPYPLRELMFYSRELPEQEHGALREILPYLPRFYGDIEVGGMQYLRLENLMRDYRRPCILDVKIGRRCYETTAPNDKKAREHKKYPYQQVVGYRAAGLKVWQPERGEYFELIRHSKTRTEVELWTGKDMEIYLSGVPPSYASEILEVLEGHMDLLVRYFERQSYFEFCAVSLLFAYEGDAEVPLADRAAPFVWLVDFAHTIAGCSQVDDNFLYGLRTFRDVMKRVRDDYAERVARGR